MYDPNKVGVIAEQGFVAGSGLGFNEMSKEEEEKIKEDEE